MSIPHSRLILETVLSNFTMTFIKPNFLLMFSINKNKSIEFTYKSNQQSGTLVKVDNIKVIIAVADSQYYTYKTICFKNNLKVLSLTNQFTPLTYFNNN